MIGYAPKPKKKEFKEADFEKHISNYLKAENFKDITIKIFNDPDKYIERLSSLQTIAKKGNEEAVMSVLLSISL